jgi:hypothetical protein
MHDEVALTAAFEGAEAAFVLLPPNFDPAPGFPEARAFATATRNALVSSNISKVVYLSTIGAQATEENLLTQHTILRRNISYPADPGYLFQAGLVHGEFKLGCRSSSQQRGDSELSPTAR